MVVARTQPGGTVVSLQHADATGFAQPASTDRPAGPVRRRTQPCAPSAVRAGRAATVARKHGESVRGYGARADPFLRAVQVNVEPKGTL
jgi:hypothetical protein